MTARPTHAARTQAAILHATWRATGVPTMVTGDEAFRLSGGATGTKGDHATPFTLAAVALSTAMARPGGVR